VLVLIVLLREQVRASDYPAIFRRFPAAASVRGAGDAPSVLLPYDSLPLLKNLPNLSL